MAYTESFPNLDAHAETISPPPGSIRRDTISTISSDKQLSLPSGRWPLPIHGNCARCGHHHKAALIYINVVEGICEASHVICERCGQKWLTIGGLNTTQISLLSAVTAEVDSREINFRYSLFSIVRSATSVASPTALSNVPEDPSRTPSRNSSTRSAHPHSDHITHIEPRSLRDPSINSATASDIEATPAHLQSNRPPLQKSLPNLRRVSAPTINSIKRRFKNTIRVLRNVRLGRPSRKTQESQMVAGGDEMRADTERVHYMQLTSPQVVASVLPESENLSINASNATVEPAMTTGQIVEELKNVDKEAIRNMTSKQRIAWIRERITTFKRSRCCSTLQCDCNRRHSASSIGDYYGLSEHTLSQPSTSSHRYALEQMGSQFDPFAAGAFFSHTGSLTLSATRISEADTAVDQPEGSSSPQSSRLELSQQARRSRSPRPASLFHSRHSWQQYRHARAQRDSMDSVLAGAARNSWRGSDLFSLAQHDIPARSDTPELRSLADPLVEETASSIAERDQTSEV